jgi:exodeoxyribonuclease VIII
LQQAESGVKLPEALVQLTSFLNQFGRKGLKVWGNGSDFDNAILAACYAAVGQPLPWDFWHNRCYRTLKALRPELKLQRQGTYHNALDDAKTQAQHAIQLLEALHG